jgi:hypothetical protein
MLRPFSQWIDESRELLEGVLRRPDYTPAAPGEHSGEDEERGEEGAGAHEVQ